MGSLDEQCTQYYGAQLLDAVEFMHSRGVIHRDLKPENILLDDKMRIKVTDFGTAKLMAFEVDQNGKKLMTFPKDFRASSFVGTAEYVSPELLADKYQGKGCDIWAFGCIIYQLIAGRPPFKASNEYQTFQKIVKLQYSYPPGFPLSVRDLVKHILVLDPSQRWSIRRIKSHPFFEGVDWNRHALWKQKHPRILPYRPSSRSSSNPISKITASFPRHNNNPTNFASSSSTNLLQSTPSTRAMVNPRSASTSNILATLPDSQTTLQNPSNPYNNGNSDMSSAKANRISLPIDAAASAYYNSNQQTQQAQKNAFPPMSIQSQARDLQAREQQGYASRQPPAIFQPRGQQLSQPPRGALPVNQNVPSNAPNKSPPIGNPMRTNVDVNGGFGENNSVTPMELPPPSSVDAEFAHLLQGSTERILRFGHIQMYASNEPVDLEKEQSRISKLFSSRKKKRALMITTNGRMLIISDNKLQMELPVTNPNITVKEFPFNKKLNVGVFSVETKVKVYTFEDPSGSVDWIAAINKAREFVSNSEAIAASNKHSTAAAAASAASNIAVANSNSNHRAVSTRRLTDGELPGKGSSMILKNDDHKMMRRGQSFSHR